MSAVEYSIEFEEPPPPQRGPKPPSIKTARRIVTPPDHIAPDSHRPHGTRAKYVLERCRCEPCRADNRQKERERRLAIQRPDQVWAPYVPAGRARQHIAELAAAGVGLKQVSRVSGVSHGTLSKLVYGLAGRGPSKRIRPETERRILGVNAGHAADAAKIPAAPTWRLLDDLIARGWTRTWIATELAGKPTPGLQIRRDLVRASTARKVAALHKRLEGQAGPGRRSRWSQ